MPSLSFDYSPWSILHDISVHCTTGLLVVLASVSIYYLVHLQRQYPGNIQVSLMGATLVTAVTSEHYLPLFDLLSKGKRAQSNVLAANENVATSHSAGDIIPLPDFVWQNQDPLKFRPFKPKYNLTMGKEHQPI